MVLASGENEEPPPAIGVAGSPWGLAVGDFTGTSALDVVVTQKDLGKVKLLQGDGTGGFLPVGDFTVGADPIDVVAADFNRDGLLDLAVANAGVESVSILPGTGGGNESALGLVGPEILTDNEDAWSGDHRMDPPSVPGVLATSRPLKRPAADLKELHYSVLAEFGIEAEAGN